MRRALRVASVVGTRPNFIKVAPVTRQLAERPDAFESVLIHTGQHYDAAMSQIFIEQLEIPAPDHNLEVGSGSHAQQTARVMERLEPLLAELKPDIVLVPGDVNSTMAAALVAVKLGIPVGHVEAGLRSFDRSMPEEINRIVTDAVSDLLFVHSPEAIDHLAREGIDSKAVHYVGNSMIDSLVRLREPIATTGAAMRLGVTPGAYLVVTLHRPALVDGHQLPEVIAALRSVSRVLPVIFPVHPRTRAALERAGLEADAAHLKLIAPLGYLEFLSLVGDAAGVLTDSGGIQEETTFLGVPCFTLRDSTERPVTVQTGTNVLLGLNPRRIETIPALLTAGGGSHGIPALWDGRAAERIVAVLETHAERLRRHRAPRPLTSAVVTGS